MEYNLSHLRALESEAIHIIRKPMWIKCLDIFLSRINTIRQMTFSKSTALTNARPQSLSRGSICLRFQQEAGYSSKRNRLTLS